MSSIKTRQSISILLFKRSVIDLTRKQLDVVDYEFKKQKIQLSANAKRKNKLKEGNKAYKNSLNNNPDALSDAQYNK
jgi:hypothetical protein